jgi:hypothetical protein
VRSYKAFLKSTFATGSGGRAASVSPGLFEENSTNGQPTNLQISHLISPVNKDFAIRARLTPHYTYSPSKNSIATSLILSIVPIS